MRYHFFLHYGWFFQNLRKEAVRTFMHTTVHNCTQESLLERTYKPHYRYQNFSPLANGTDLNREKYAILQTHWH